jgi:hypothetical protein
MGQVDALTQRLLDSRRAVAEKRGHLEKTNTKIHQVAMSNKSTRWK